MAAHPYAEIVKAMADNGDLIIFGKLQPGSGSAWVEASFKELVEMHFHDFFLCLPQHKEACLHWLNGGKSQLEYTHASYPVWNDIDNDATDWSVGHVFMDESLNIRIKPRKEKRYVVIYKGILVGQLYKCDADIRASYGPDYCELQTFEIEVEI